MNSINNTPQSAVEEPVHEILARRASAHEFSPRAVAPVILRSVLEAARWAPSSFNAQPWAFVVGDKQQQPDAHEAIASTLMDINRRWAADAPVLIVTIARTTYPHNGAPNRHGWHDVGMATANLLTQATALGLVAGPMGGFDPKAAREKLAIPEGWEPVAVIALGYPAAQETAANAAKAVARKPRQRNPLEQFVFAGRWGQPADLNSSRRANEIGPLDGFRSVGIAASQN
ncbi:MAG: nitroreductase family protein [Candidatus Acidiferrales bacterium]